MASNPWEPRPPAKKRIITVSVTAEQDEAFEALKARLGYDTDGALIKHALRELHDRTSDVSSTGDHRG